MVSGYKALSLLRLISLDSLSDSTDNRFLISPTFWIVHFFAVPPFCSVPLFRALLVIPHTTCVMLECVALLDIISCSVHTLIYSGFGLWCTWWLHVFAAAWWGWRHSSWRHFLSSDDVVVTLLLCSVCRNTCSCSPQSSPYTPSVFVTLRVILLFIM